MRTHSFAHFTYGKAPHLGNGEPSIERPKCLHRRERIDNETRTQGIEKQKQSEAHYSWPSCPRCDCTGSACLHEQHCLRLRQPRMGQDLSAEQQGQSRKG